ncbi:MAG: HU family DNA-binding protein [Clostridia bacterium]|nr:HU family DNA-binding protein [Clostridia bacterium]
MNKTELIAEVAKKTGMTKKDTDKIVDAVLVTIAETLGKGEKVSISGFGAFDVRVRPEHEGKNPRTKKTIIIPASKAPVFKASKNLKDAIDK